MAWELSIDSQFQSQLDWTAQFVRVQIGPLEAATVNWTGLRTAIDPLRQQVKDRGLWAVDLPEALGGQGLGQVKLALMHELLGASVFASLVFGVGSDAENSALLAAAGTSDQRRRWLIPLLAGKISSAIALSEFSNASGGHEDPSTTAVVDGGEWVINGQSSYTSATPAADFMIVVAVTNSRADRRHRTSAFIVPTDSVGVQIVRNTANIENLDPTNANCWPSPTVVVLQGVRVPGDAMIGGPGDGLAIAQNRLSPRRIHHCMRWIGQARRVIDLMCQRSADRCSDGRTHVDNQAAQNWIANTRAKIQAARLMTLHAAWVIDSHGFRAARADFAIINVFCAKLLRDVINHARQGNTGVGRSPDRQLAWMHRAARAERIDGGLHDLHGDNAPGIPRGGPPQVAESPIGAPQHEYTIDGNMPGPPILSTE